jgi:hypothetical protein
MVRAGGPRSRAVFTFSGLETTQPIPEWARHAGFSAVEEHGGEALWRRYLGEEPHEHAWVARLGVAVV